jgi:hypothetical protein
LFTAATQHPTTANQRIDPCLYPPPDGMVVCHLPYGPTAYFGLFNTVLRHDIGQKKEVGTIRWAGGGVMWWCDVVA